LKGTQLPLLEREVTELAVEIMERADSQRVRMVYREGLSEMISAFNDGEGAQQAIRLLEERSFLDMVLNEALDSAQDDLSVVVAGDGRWDEINRLSMVLSRYGVPGQMSGAIGVLGPTHINYGRAISTVRYVSSLMTNMLAELYEDNETAPSPPPDDSG
jgi:heat-inducible transcriptional repressor